VTKALIELKSFDGCESCEDALNDIKNLVGKYPFELNLIKYPIDKVPDEYIGITFPLTCVTNEKGTNCINGWGPGYKNYLEKLLEE